MKLPPHRSLQHSLSTVVLLPPPTQRVAQQTCVKATLAVAQQLRLRLVLAAVWSVRRALPLGSQDCAFCQQ